MMLALDARPRLLVVEDDADLLTIVQEVLEEEGYAVTPTPSLSSSLTLLDSQLYQQVLTDLFAPTGQDPLHSIRPLLTHAAPTPVGVLTGWSVTAEAAAAAGV